MTQQSSLIKVFRFFGEEGFQWLLPCQSSDNAKLSFDAQPRTASWVPVKMKLLIEDERETRLQTTDFPACGGALIMSAKATEMIGDKLRSYGELLPLVSDDGDFWAFNTTCMIDALDLKKSELLWSPEQGRLLMIHRHIFVKEKVSEAIIFKVPQFKRGTTFVTGLFVEMIRSSGCSGLKFKEVWSSE